MPARAALLFMASLGACTVSPLAGAGRPCSTGVSCGGGTVCDPARNLCVAVAVDQGLEGIRPADLRDGESREASTTDARADRGRLEAGPPLPPSYITSVGGWGWRHPLPQGNTLNAVFALAPGDAWAVGNGGTILRFDGNRWYAVASGTSATLNAVWAASATEAWAAGEQATLLRFDGKGWTPQPLPGAPTAPLRALWGSSPQDVWTGGQDLVFHYDGSAWAAMAPTTGGSKELTGIWGSASTDVWFANRKSDLLRYQAGSWSKYSSKGSSAEALWGFGANDVWAVGQEVIHYTGGTDWQQAAGGNGALTGIWGASANDIWAVGRNGDLRHYQGSWSALPALLPLDLSSVSGAAGKAWAVGSSGVTLRLDGNWSIWGSRVSTRRLNGVWGPPSSKLLWAVGDGGALLHFDGALWSSLPSATTKHLNGIWGDSPSQIFAVGDSGTLLKYDGAQWQVAVADTSSALYGIHGCSASDVWAVGGTCVTDCSVVPCVTTCTAASTHFDGNGWKAIKPGANKILRAVFCHGAGTAVAVGDGGTVLSWDPSSASWKAQSSTTTAALHAVWGTSSSPLWVAGANGTLLRSSGSSWSLFPSGTTVPLEGLWGASGSDLWAVGQGGVILHHDGVSWSPVASGAVAGLHAIWGRGSSDVWAVGENAAVLHYDDRLP